MRSLVLLALCLAVPAALGLPGAVLTTQFQAQDALGQYTYGYSGDSSAKQEIQTHDGVTRGTFSYVDGNGHLQSRSYVSDDIHGFRVAATDLPVGPSPVLAAAPVLLAAPHAPLLSLGVPHDTPEVMAAKIAHAHAHAEALARAHGRRRRSLDSHSSVLVAGPAQPSAAVVGAISPAASLAGPSGSIVAHASSSGSVVSEHGAAVVTPPVHGAAVVAGPQEATHLGLGAVHAVHAVHAQPLLAAPDLLLARIAHAQAYAGVLSHDDYGYRRRRSVEAVVGPSSPETVLKGPAGAGVVIAPATPGGSVVRAHGVTAVVAPAAPAVVLAAPVEHVALAHHGEDLGQYSYDDGSYIHDDYA